MCVFTYPYSFSLTPIVISMRKLRFIYTKRFSRLCKITQQTKHTPGLKSSYSRSLLLF